MNHTPCVAIGLSLLSQPLWAADGGFFEDAKASLSARNYYFSRDFSDIVGANQQSKAEEWAQGFILDFKSGYTPGTVGFGVDALGLLGIRLDSSPDRVNTGLLPVHGDGRAASEYSRLAPTFKARLSKTELRVGELQPNLPVLTFSDIRLLPPTYQGVSLSSSEIDGLTLQAGHLRSTHLRNEAGDGKLNAMLGHVPMRQAESDAFNYVGGDYAFNANLSSLSLWHGQLEDIYQQSFVGFKHSKPLGTGYSVPTWATSRPARMAMRCWGISTTRRSFRCSPPSVAGTASAPVTRPSTATARSHGCLPTSARWATKCRPMSSPIPTNARISCATTTTSRPWVSRG
jgi:hypothetical protein